MVAPTADSLKIADVLKWINIATPNKRIEMVKLERKLPWIVREFVIPLLSIRIAGSMTVERIAKPFKTSVVNKQRNRLSVAMADHTLRLGLNLRFLLGYQQSDQGAAFRDLENPFLFENEEAKDNMGHEGDLGDEEAWDEEGR